MTCAMWRELRAVFERLQAHGCRCARVRDRLRRGRRTSPPAATSTSSPAFASTRRACATSTSTTSRPPCRRCWPATCRCVAQIDGACIGGGLEIARLLRHPHCRRRQPLRRADRQARLPDGAGRDADRGRRDRQHLAARDCCSRPGVLDAADGAARGLVHHVVGDDRRRGRGPAPAPSASPRCRRRRRVSTSARCAPSRRRRCHAPTSASPHYAYADSAEHREGMAAFIDKRTPRF